MAAARKSDTELTDVTAADQTGANPLSELNHRLAAEAAQATTAEARTAAAEARAAGDT